MYFRFVTSVTGINDGRNPVTGINCHGYYPDPSRHYGFSDVNQDALVGDHQPDIVAFFPPYVIN